MKRHGDHLAIVAVSAVFLLSSLSFAAPPLPSVEVTGDFKVNGTGNAVVFSDGTRQTSAAVQYVRTILVSPVAGGTEQQNGTALLTALAGIADASAAKPYLLKIEPGIYDIEANTLQMKPYVDIEGSGVQITIIKGAISNDLHKGVVMGASNAELRDLLVENCGDVGGTWAFAIVSEYASPKITRVHAKASGTNYNVAIRIGSAAADMTFVTAEALGPSEGRGIETFLVTDIDTQPPEMIIRHARVLAKSYGVVNRTAVTMVDSEISASANPSWGFSVFGTLKLHNCRVKGTTASVHVQGPPSWSGSAYAANTQLDGGMGGTGSRVCVNAYNASFVALNTSCGP